MANILPKTFSGGGYQVTVNADRSILVKQGDWLSKYTMAIWGDFKPEHIAAFKRKIGGAYRNIDNPDLIKTGETLYIMAPLPGENGIGIFPGEDKPGGSLPGTGGEPETEPVMHARRISEFLRWLRQTFSPTPDWAVGDTNGGDLSVSFINVAYQGIGVIYKPTQVLTWFRAVAGGLTLGFPDDVSVGGSLSPTDFPGAGAILKSPIYDKLELDDFRHGTMSVEGGMGILMGGSLSMMFFGMGFPPSRVLNSLRDFLYHGDRGVFGTLLMKGAPSGVMVFAGMNMVPPGAGISARVGVMYDRGYWGI